MRLTADAAATSAAPVQHCSTTIIAPSGAVLAEVLVEASGASAPRRQRLDRGAIST